MTHHQSTFKTSQQRGFSLVELMVSLILGLMVILAVGNIFLAGRKTMNSTEALARTQESSRVSFELMGRDLREAGANTCSSAVRIGSTLNSHATAWWTNWSDGLRGYASGTAAAGTASGSGVGQRVASTDAIDIYSALDADANVITKMTAGSSPLTVESTSTLAVGDIALACDTEAAFMFQITGRTGSALAHSSGSGAPGNCANVFSYTDMCSGAATGYLFDTDAMVARVSSFRWYIGNNSEGGRSLYRARLTNTGTSNTPSTIETVEVASGINNMTITYMERGGTDYVGAAAVADWGQVVAVRVVLTLTAATNNTDVNMGGNGGRTLERQMTQTIALRNR